MKNPKRMIFFILAVILGGALLIYFLWSNLPDLSEKQNITSFPEPKNIEIKKKSGKLSLDFNENDFLTPAAEALNEVIESNPPAIFNPSPSYYPSYPLGESFFKPSPTPAKNPENQVTVTEKEVFEFAYSADYINVLKGLNQTMIQDGFIPTGQEYPITNMEEAIIFQDKFADYVEKFSDLPKGEVDKYRLAYRELLPKLWKKELLYIKEAGQSSNAPEKFWNFFKANLAKREAKNLFASIRQTVIPDANAFSAALSAECFQEGPPTGVRGSQRSAPCCNCTIFKKPVGCLNRVCAGNAAVWDELTSICGCNI